MSKPARPMGKLLTEEERQGIIEAYAAGASIRSIWRLHGYAKPTIHRTISAAGMELRRDATPAKFSDPQLRAWLRHGWTVQRIVDKTGATRGTIVRRMTKAGLQVTELPESLPAAEIVAAYASGCALRTLANQYDAHTSTIRRLIVRHGGTIRTNSASPRITPQALIAFCRQGLTVKQISVATGATAETVRTHLADNGLLASRQRPRKQPPVSQINTQEAQE